MDLSHLIFISFFLAVFLHLLSEMRLRRGGSKCPTPPASLPPGPWKLPIVGSMHHLLGSTLPHRRLADLAKKHGPIIHLQLGEVPAIVISSAEAARAILQTHDATFASRPKVLAGDILTYGSQNVAFASYGKHWRQMKKVFVTELLTASRVQSFRSMREEEVQDLILGIAAESSKLVDMSGKFKALTHNMVSRAAFGKRFMGQEKFLALLTEAGKLAGAFNVADYFPSSAIVRKVSGIESRIRNCHCGLDEILQHILVERKEERKRMRDGRGGGEQSIREDEDLFDVLLRLQEEEGAETTLSDDTLKASILDVFVAGTETSAAIMEWAMSELMRNPQMMMKAQDEIRKTLQGKSKITSSDIKNLNYLKLVIKEAMRLYPPGPLLVPRECTETCQVLGYKIPKNTRVFVNAWSIARDPQYWEEPEVFKPERFEDSLIDFKGQNFEFLPFGGGRRICPGILFGLESMELPLAALLYYFNWKLPLGIVPSKLDMTEAMGLSMPRRSSLQLFPIPHSLFHNM